MGKMIGAAAWLVAAAAVAAVACAPTGGAPRGQAASDMPAHDSSAADSTITVIGTVRHLAVEGGVWVVRGDDSTTYDPHSLPAEYQQEGLRVRLRARFMTGMVGIHQVGRMVEVVGVEKL